MNIEVRKNIEQHGLQVACKCMNWILWSFSTNYGKCTCMREAFLLTIKFLKEMLLMVWSNYFFEGELDVTNTIIVLI